MIDVEGVLEGVRATLKSAIDRGITPYAIAKRGEFSQIILTRFLNDSDITFKTAAKIVDACRQLEAERGTPVQAEVKPAAKRGRTKKSKV